MAAPEMTSITSLVCRLFWMVIGPMVLAVLAYNIAAEGQGWLTSIDVAYFAVLGGIMLARWIEIRRGGALTADGEPATPEHLRRYLVVLGILGISVWIVVNLISTQGLLA